MSQPLVECVPNFSEGRRENVVQTIVNAIKSVAGVRLLDCSSDTDHNRTVVTFVGPPEAVEAAAYEAIKTAAAHIDLEQHTGEHPRIGATDVVPFIPIRDVSMDDCVALAKRLAKRVGAELHIPVYLYESAATRPDRENLENIRKGEYEGLKEAIQTDPNRAPDFGPAALGKAGATVIGARPPLIAYNVYLTTDNVEIARKIAKAMRNSSGGFRFVKAAGFLVDGKAQVSMNLTNYEKTPIYRVQEAIRREAQRYGVGILHAELVGLIPENALIDAAQWYLQLDVFDRSQILERKLADSDAAATLTAGDSSSFVESVAAGTPTPGGGAGAALAGTLAAALTEMVARLTSGRKKYADVDADMQRVIAEVMPLRLELAEAIEHDSRAYQKVMAAYKLDSVHPRRDDTIQSALMGAAEVPLQVMNLAIKVLELADIVAEKGNPNAASDAAVGAHMALAAVEGAALNVSVNAKAITDEMAAATLHSSVTTLTHQARALHAKVVATAETRVGLR